MLKGVDVSNLNGSINMSLIKNAGNSFVIAKATEGSTFLDKFYSSNVENARAQGFVVGAYHFARFTTEEKTIQEARFFKSTVEDTDPDFVVLDFEQQCSGDMTDLCLKFLDAVSSVAPAVIYCNPSYIKAHLNSRITRYPLWIAHYGVSSPSTLLWPSYNIWQYTDKGQISGLGGYIDLDYMTEDFYNSVKGGKEKVKYVVISGKGPDERAANYLADYLQCPVMTNDKTFDYSQFENVIGVGGKKEQYTSYLTRLISGADRYETMQLVLNFIKGERNKAN